MPTLLKYDLNVSQKKTKLQHSHILQSSVLLLRTAYLCFVPVVYY